MILKTTKRNDNHYKQEKSTPYSSVKKAYKIILLTLMCCNCFYAIAQDAEVYVTGYFTNGSLRASVFQNNKKLHEPFGVGMAIAVAENGDVYVAGYSSSKATIWKNGTVLYTLSSRNGSANAIVLNGNDVWATGYENDAGGKKVAKVWKNGQGSSMLSGGGGGLRNAEGHAIAVVGSYVYVAGYETNTSGIKVATVWRNGDILHSFSNDNGRKDSEFRGIAVEGGVVYTAGYIKVGAYYEDGHWYETFSSPTPVPKVWRNNKIYHDIPGVGEAHSIVVKNGYTFVSGCTYEYSDPIFLLRKAKSLKVWMDGENLYTYNQTSNATRSSIAIFGDDWDIYVTSLDKVWRDNKLLYTLPSATATSIFVKKTVVTATLNRNGGTGGSTSVTPDYGWAMPAITPPTRTGYTFQGYFDTSAQTGGKQYYSASGSSAANWDKTTSATLYARWTLNPIVTSIVIKTQPALSYTEGVQLNLSGLVATITSSNMPTEDVTFANFASKGLTTSPFNGTALTLAHNATPVTVTHSATGKSATTNNLTVGARTLAGVSIKTQPFLNYVEGRALDLSGLVASLVYSNSTTENVAFANFASRGLTVDLAHGAILTLAHNAAPITVTHTATGFSGTTGNLSVMQAGALSTVIADFETVRTAFCTTWRFHSSGTIRGMDKQGGAAVGNGYLSFEFDVPPGGYCTAEFPTNLVNLTGATGITFWHRGAAGHIMVMTSQYSPGSFEASVPAHAVWTKVTIPFSSMLGMWGAAEGIMLTDISRVIGIGFGSTGKGTFDIDHVQIDDIIVPAPCAIVKSTVIADCETTETNLCTNWWDYSDERGSTIAAAKDHDGNILMTQGGAAQGAGYVSVDFKTASNSLYGVWGVGFGFNLALEDTPVDLTGATSLTFYHRGAAGNAVIHTQQYEEGFSAPVAAHANWTKVTIPLSDMMITYGVNEGIRFNNRTKALTVQFGIGAEWLAKTGTFSIDHVQIDGIEMAIAPCIQDQEPDFEFAVNQTVTYGEYVILSAVSSNPAPVTYTSSNGAVAEISGNMLMTKGGGTVVITASQPAGNGYLAVSKTFNLTVEKAPLIIRADNKSRNEGETNPTFTLTYSGFKFGDNANSLIALPIASCIATPSSPAGVYPISLTEGLDINYEYTLLDGELTVTALTGTEITFTIPPVTYGNQISLSAISNNSMATITYSSSNSSIAEIQGNVLIARAAGDVVITASHTAGNGFAAASKPVALTISKAPLLIGAYNASRTEGEANPAFAFGYSGFKFNDNASSLFLLPAISCAATPSSPAGVYPITLIGGSDPNYEYTLVNGVLTVTALTGAEITFTIPAVTYGDQISLSATSNNSMATITYSSSDNTIAEISGDRLIARAAGDVVITASHPAGNGFAAASKQVDLKIAKAPLLIGAYSVSRKEGEENPPFTLAYSGFKFSDNENSLFSLPAISCAATPSSPAGNYTITLTGGSDPNYEYTLFNGQLQVIALTGVVISFTVPPVMYGDEITLNASSVNNLTAITYSSSDNTIADVQGNKLIARAAGNVTITASQAAAGDFAAGSQTVSLTIAKAPLTITANSFTRKEGEANPTFTRSYSAFKFSDSESSLSQLPVIGCSATTSSPAGLYPITLTNGLDTNYEYTLINGQLQVTALTGVAISFTIDGAVAYGDEITLNAASTNAVTAITYSSSDNTVAEVQGDKLIARKTGNVAITASQAAGNDFAAGSRTVNLTIAKAPLTITANDFIRNVGEANPTFTLSYSGFKFSDSASSLISLPTASSSATTTSLTGFYPITLAGGSDANYEYLLINGQLTVFSASGFNYGDGSQADPYLISSKTDMEILAAKVNTGETYAGKYFRLTRNLTGGSDTVTVITGSSLTNSFSGIFDGDGYEIAVKMTATTNYTGLFGYINNATIKNLGVSGIVNGLNYTGGICGYSSSSVITNCYNTATINASFSSTSINNYIAGGICGYMIGSTGKINGCYNSGNISSVVYSAPSYAGGICGFISSGTAGIENCYNTGTILARIDNEANTTNVSRAGGICGYTASVSTVIRYCYNTGDVSSYNAGNTPVTYVGGICGQYGAVQNCFVAACSISNSNDDFFATRAGRIGGSNGTYSGNRADGDASVFVNGRTVSGNATDKNASVVSTPYLQNSAWLATNLSWDFTDVWCMTASEEEGYPLLKTQPQTKCAADMPVELSFSINREVRYGDVFALNATSENLMAVTYTSSDAGVATIGGSTGSTLTARGTGTVAITASQPAGNGFLAASATVYLTVSKAPLKITANRKIRKEGKENPEFTLSYSGFKLNNNASSLDELPTVICDADVTSPAGFYPIMLTGGSDKNYEYTLINGVLQILAPNPDCEGIKINFDDKAIGEVFKTIFESGLILQDTNAVIAADPLREGNSLKIKSAGYDMLTYFTVTLPEGYTVSDIDEFRFETFFATEEKASIELFIAPVSPTGTYGDLRRVPVYLKSTDGLFGNPAPQQVSSAGEWYQIAVTKEQILDNTYNYAWNHTPDFAIVDNLKQFVFGVGISIPGNREYYIDNISFCALKCTPAHTVSFDAGEGMEAIEPQLLCADKTAEEPFPTRPGYNFDGWYDGDDYFYFNTPITFDVELTAKWTPHTNAHIIHFEDKPLGLTYGIAAAGGATRYTHAVVTPDPARVGKSLKISNPNYEEVAYFTVTLPEGYTVADIKNIKFETYYHTTKNDVIDLFIAPTSVKIGDGVQFRSYPVYLQTSDGLMGKPAPQQVSSAGEWYPISISREQILDPTFNFARQHTPDFAAVDTLSQFLFGIGVCLYGAELHLDNITFVLKEEPANITFDIAPLAYGDQIFLNAISNNSETEITYTSSNSAIAEIWGNILTAKGTGTVTITASQAAGGDFLANSKTFDLTISKAPLTIIAENKNRIVGEANPAFTLSYSGFGFADDAESLALLPTISCEATASSPAGLYPIALTGGSDSNYAYQLTDGVLRIMVSGGSLFGGGDGSQADPYLISLKEDMETLAENVNGGETYAGKYFRLTRNLTGGNDIVTTIVGSHTIPFSGTFDGDGHEIAVKIDATVDGDGYTGVFGFVFGATIKNLGVSGGITGMGFAAGGICGYMDNSIIEDCYNKATVSLTNFTPMVGEHGAGGIAGYLPGGNNRITRCYNSGNISSSVCQAPYNIANSGGIFGFANTYDGVIENCYNRGTISAIANDNTNDNLFCFSRAGGIGGNATGVTIKSCYSTGDVSAYKAGVTFYSTVAGGIFGTEGFAQNCFVSESRITNNNDIDNSRIARIGTVGNVNDCYAEGTSVLINGFTKNFTESANYHEGMDAAVADFQNESWITDNLSWDFDNVWCIPSGGGYPVFKVKSEEDQPAVISFVITQPVAYGDQITLSATSNNSTAAITYTSSDNTIAEISGSTLTARKAGNVTITASQPAGNGFLAGSQPVDLTVGKATLTITANDAVRKQGEANPSFTLSYSGFKFTDNSSALAQLPTISCDATESSPVGFYPITLSGGSDSNYEYQLNDGELEVTTLTSVVISFTIAAVEYGDQITLSATSNNSATAITYASSDNTIAEISGNTLTARKAGYVTITASQPAGGEFSAGSQPVELNIAKATLSITANDAIRRQGEANPEFTLSYSGFKFTDNAGSLTQLPTITCSATESSSAGFYPIVLTGGSDSNYEYQLNNGELEVTALTNVVISFTIPAVKYGDAPITLTATSTNTATAITYASSDNTIAEVSGNTLTVKKAGNVTITASQAAGGEFAAGSQAVELTVAKATLSITANDAIRRQGEANPEFTLSYSGFKFTDNAGSLTQLPTITCSATESSPVGFYPIVLAGGSDSNYEYQLNNGELEVTALTNVVISFTIPAVTYGDAPITLTATSTNTATAITYASSDNTIAEVSGNTLTIKQAGDVTITASQPASGEFAAGSQPFNLTVAKAPLTITANSVTRLLGERNPIFTLSYSGFKNGENQSLLNYLPVATCGANESSVAGNYEILLSGGSDNNYSYTLVNGTLVVSASMDVDDLDVSGITVPETGITIIPEDISAKVVWRTADDAAGYTLVIYADANRTVIVCALEFDAIGRLLSITFGLRAGASHDVLGIRITNLTENTTYYYTMQTLDEDYTVLDTKEGTFTTTGKTGIKDVTPHSPATPIGYYTILGQRLSQEPERGVYIILYDNGKTEKVVR